MANTHVRIPEGGPGFGYTRIESSIDTFASHAKDADGGPTTLYGIRMNVASGSDFLMIWDDRNPSVGTTAPDYQIPTGAETQILFVGGVPLSNGLTYTVSNVGGTSCSGDPGAANTIVFVTAPS